MYIQLKPFLLPVVFNCTHCNNVINFGVKQIYSAGSAFAALRADGSVVTWGDAYDVSSDTLVPINLDAVVANQLVSDVVSGADINTNDVFINW